MVMRTHQKHKPRAGAVLVTEKDWNKPFVELFIGISFCLCFFMSWFSHPLFSAKVVQLGGLGFACLWVAFKLGLSRHLVVHLTTLIGSILCISVILATGGTVSVVMVVFVGLAWMPFLLLSLRSAIAWLIAQFNALLIVFVASQFGWIHTQPNLLPETSFWNLAIKLQAIVAMILILDFLYRSRQNQINALQIRGDELEKLHIELIRAQSHKDEFIASVGHELRTPMNAILGLNSVLKDEIQNDAADLKRVELIRKSTQHLLCVVNDILDFSQLQAHRMVLNLEAFSFQNKMKEHFEKFKIRALSKSLNADYLFDPELPEWILGDEKRLLQMLNAMLENALKFTHQGGISLRLLHHPIGLRMEVQDTGIGMTDEQILNVFGRFEKSATPGLKLYGGTGLGLSICERLVQLHGGQIGVQSQLNKCSLFWIELPITPAQPAQHQPEQGNPTTKHSPQHFLIVDDHPVNLMVAKQMVKKSWPQARIDTVSTGQEALIFIQQHDVDMILMDMLMPDMDGMEVTRIIRQLPSVKKQTPILGLTASSNSEDLENCLAAGMNAMVLKPLEEQELEKGVSACFRKSQDHRV